MAGRSDPDGMVVAADRDGGGTVVDLVGDTDTRTEVECRRHRIRRRRQYETLEPGAWRGCGR